MTDSKGLTAEEIIKGPQVDEEEGVEDSDDEVSEEDLPTVEEECRSLHMEAIEIISRFEKTAEKFKLEGNKTATKKDIANLYLALSGDVASLVKALVAVTGAGFEELFDEDEDGEEGSDDAEGPSEDELFDEQATIYTALSVTNAAFNKLREGMPDTSGVDQVIAVNREAMRLIEDRCGAEEVRAASLKKLQLAGQSDAPENS